jgi:hypothetical protein
MTAIGQQRSFTDSSFDCVVSGQKQGPDRRARGARGPGHPVELTSWLLSPVASCEQVDPCYTDRAPSTSIETPLMNAASSEARKRQALATSSGVEKRPRGMVAR